MASSMQPCRKRPLEGGSAADPFTVLLIDDSPLEKETVVILCQSYNYEVKVADNEPDALGILKDATTDVDLMVVDFYQPKPFDCFKFIERVVKLRPSLAIVVVSADEKPGFLLNCIYTPSLAGFFVKPLKHQCVGMFPAFKQQHQRSPQQDTRVHGLPTLQRVQDQQFTVVSYQQNRKNAAWVSEICSSVGWGIAFRCRSVHNEPAFQSALHCTDQVDIVIVDSGLTRASLLQCLRECNEQSVPCLSK